MHRIHTLRLFLETDAKGFPPCANGFFGAGGATVSSSSYSASIPSISPSSSSSFSSSIFRFLPPPPPPPLGGWKRSRRRGGGVRGGQSRGRRDELLALLPVSAVSGDVEGWPTVVCGGLGVRAILLLRPNIGEQVGKQKAMESLYE